MPDHRGTIPSHTRPARALQPPHPRVQQRRWRLDIRAREVPAGRIARVVKRGAIAVTAEEQHVQPPRRPHQIRRLDEWAVALVAVEDLDGPPDEREAVLGGDLLQHYRRGKFAVGIAAGALLTEGVAVDFIHDVQIACRVREAGGIDGAAVGHGASEGAVLWLVRPCDVR